MSLYRKTVEEISRNKSLREEGKDISIPSPFSRMSSYWPGIQQGKYYLISANQKVSGKINNKIFYIKTCY